MEASGRTTSGWIGSGLALREERGDVARKIGWQYSAQISETREWVDNAHNRERLFTVPTQRLSSAASAVAVNWDAVGLDLSDVGLWHSAVGVVQVATPDPTGWDSIQLGMLYRYWSARATIGSWEANRDGNKKFYGILLEPALCAMHALATHSDEIADWCGGLLIHALADARFQIEFTPLESFVAELFRTWRGLDRVGSRTRSFPMFVYKKLFETWDDPGAFATALSAVCDYHCARVNKPSGYPEFAASPYDVFPAEILAVERVRADVGKASPRISHKLLNTPFADPPNQPPPLSDHLLTHISERIRSELPSTKANK